MVMNRQMWEYKTVEDNNNGTISDERLNILGKEGWELVGIIAVPQTPASGCLEPAWQVKNNNYIFKRPKE